MWRGNESFGSPLRGDGNRRGKGDGVEWRRRGEDSGNFFICYCIFLLSDIDQANLPYSLSQVWNEAPAPRRVVMEQLFLETKNIKVKRKEVGGRDKEGRRGSMGGGVGEWVEGGNLRLYGGCLSWKGVGGVGGGGLVSLWDIEEVREKKAGVVGVKTKGGGEVRFLVGEEEVGEWLDVLGWGVEGEEGEEGEEEMMLLLGEIEVGGAVECLERVGGSVWSLDGGKKVFYFTIFLFEFLICLI